MLTTRVQYASKTMKRMKKYGYFHATTVSGFQVIKLNGCEVIDSILIINFSMFSMSPRIVNIVTYALTNL